MTPHEIDEERRRARELAVKVGGVLAILLGAVPAGNRINWDPQAARFLVDGQYVSAEELRKQLLRMATRVGNLMVERVDRLVAKQIDLETWRREMQKLIGSAHVIAGALALGSINIAAADAKVQEQIESERKYAAGFAAAIVAKNIKPQTIRTRARSYMSAPLVTFAVAQIYIRKLVGYTEARRVLTAKESCTGCRMHGYQWMPIDLMPPIGSQECGSRCRCYLEYR